MDLAKSHYYSGHCKILTVFGQWPYLSKLQKYLRMSSTLIFIISMYIPLVGDLLYYVEQK